MPSREEAQRAARGLVGRHNRVLDEGDPYATCRDCGGPWPCKTAVLMAYVNEEGEPSHDDSPSSYGG
jgi:hypothetical protein